MTTLASNRGASNPCMQFSASWYRVLSPVLCCCLAPACLGQANPTGKPAIATSKAEKKQLREAEEAYLSGAKKLEGDELDAAEADFSRAAELDPANSRYALAISVVREHRVTELVRQSSQARRQGDTGKAETLLQQARSIDPENPIVLEHSIPEAVQTQTSPSAALTDPAAQPWHIEVPRMAGPIVVQPASELKSFDLRGQSNTLLQQVAQQYGIRVVLDPSVETRDIHFALQNVPYERAMFTLTTMTHTFAVPLDAKTIMLARETPENRGRLERQLQETIAVPGATPQKMQEIANVIRNIFNLKQVVVDPGAGRIVVRGPESVFAALNSTLQPLMDTGGEVLLEVRLYEISKSSTTQVGAKLPTEFTAFNVNQAARQIVSNNQSLVQQAIAQGFVSANATDLQIALALIGSGLVQSDLAKNLIGVFGGGVLQTAVSSSTSGVTLNLSRNATETRALDDVQLRVNDREEATFRAGTRYPVTVSTFSTGGSAPSSALNNATINGVNVGNLLQNGVAGTTIPQTSYEDLGVTLTAKPTFQGGDRISMQLDLKIQALAGTGLNDIPILLNRHFVTSLSVANGESALIVSDVSKTESAAVEGIPGLSELPGLGPPTERDTIRDSGQLVVVVTPHIVKNRRADEPGPRIAVTLPPSP